MKLYDATSKLEYEHNRSVEIHSSIGTIVLTFKTREGQHKDDTALDCLFESVDEIPPYEDPARNAPSFFQAALYDENNKIVDLAYSVIESEAIKELYRRDGVRRMEREFYFEATSESLP